MLCFQDPTDEKAKCLQESLLAECKGSVMGAGAYAFVTKDGLSLLFEDAEFQKFLKKGCYTLVVGMDDVTNERTLSALQSLKEKHGQHLQIKCYLHEDRGSTFHPKFSFFCKKDGGTLVLGSGNLTQRGLRHNREAYQITHYSKEEMAEVSAEWDRWYAHSSPFLFDISAPAVQEKAKSNAEKYRLMRSVNAASGKLSPRKKAEKATGAIHPMQEVPAEAVEIPLLPDSELTYDADYWQFGPESSILIAEIPKSRDRWMQVNFDKNTFENYFGATCGTNGEYRVLLKNIREDGTLAETEIRPSVSVTSHNYRFELRAARGLAYPEGADRPIAVFAKVSYRDFLYMLLMPDHTEYHAVETFLSQTVSRSAQRMRRLQYQARNVEPTLPNLVIWRKMTKEEHE